MSTQHESGFDPIADARKLDLLDPAATVLPSELLSRSSGRFQDARIKHDLFRRCGARRVDVDHGLGGRLDGSLARPLRAGAHDDPLLRGAKTDDRGSRDPEREHHGQDRLAVLVTQGVHSTRRAAAPSMIRRGRPTNPSGTGIA